ncbi:UDP-N-acetylmuramate dehydrogenase [Nocardioides aequoreus]|uniref:UDP-N-acetylmuramate dehydrogenase n=1 Tax=Nocardioides aequoreus TaxID=397278 RepID=UPI00068FC939|nr:UDP-N-acetylmuramate dehydrogenase [Nocardioides aequoreus]
MTTSEHPSGHHSGRDSGQGTLADLTTLRLGGPAEELVVAGDEAALVEAVREADEAGRPVLVVGGGSNLVVADEGVPGRVVVVRSRGLQVESDLCGGAYVEVAAGEPWDDLVASAVSRGWIGLEALSGIPGTTGATPIQNVGAYGQEVSQTLARVRTWDRERGTVRTFAAADCGFGYRTSRFKAEPGRFVVLSTTFQLGLGDLGTPVRYAELARALGVEVGERASSAEVRRVVLELRRGKGMVLDPDDHDTWSTGSFFTNPVVPADQVPDGAPAWPVGEAEHKTSAAWLIEHAGFGKGHGGDGVRVSSRHTLALTNRGGGSTAELLALAREIRDGVRARFGITLEPEPVLVGCGL